MTEVVWGVGRGGGDGDRGERSELLVLGWADSVRLVRLGRLVVANKGRGSSGIMGVVRRGGLQKMGLVIQSFRLNRGVGKGAGGGWLIGRRGGRMVVRFRSWRMIWSRRR